MLQASPGRLARDLEVLAHDIGVRLAGTPGERAAADHVMARARQIGADAWEETFPVHARVVSEEQLEIRVDGAWRAFPCSLFSNTPGTKGEWRRAEIAVLAPTDYQRDDLASCAARQSSTWGATSNRASRTAGSWPPARRSC